MTVPSHYLSVQWRDAEGAIHETPLEGDGTLFCANLPAGATYLGMVSTTWEWGQATVNLRPGIAKPWTLRRRVSAWWRDRWWKARRNLAHDIRNIGDWLGALSDKVLP